jgi:hypothetical protein
MTSKIFWLFCLPSFLVLSAAAQTSLSSTSHPDRDRLVGPGASSKLNRLELTLRRHPTRSPPAC